MPFVVAAEVGGVIVADLVARLGGVEVLADHQPTRLLKSNLLLKLQRTHGSDGFKVRVEAREAHPQLAGDGLDPQWLVEVLAELFYRTDHPVRLAAERGEVAHAAALRPGQ